MIYLRKEGQYLKIGLNITLMPDNLVVSWVWFDFARQEASSRGFAVSRHGFRRRAARWNVIDNYLRMNELSVVHTEVLQDLKAVEASTLRLNEHLSYIKPRSTH